MSPIRIQAAPKSEKRHLNHIFAVAIFAASSFLVVRALSPCAYTWSIGVCENTLGIQSAGGFIALAAAVATLWFGTWIAEHARDRAHGETVRLYRIMVTAIGLLLIFHGLHKAIEAAALAGDEGSTAFVAAWSAVFGCILGAFLVSIHLLMAFLELVADTWCAARTASWEPVNVRLTRALREIVASIDTIGINTPNGRLAISCGIRKCASMVRSDWAECQERSAIVLFSRHARDANIANKVLHDVADWIQRPICTTAQDAKSVLDTLAIGTEDNRLYASLSELKMRYPVLVVSAEICAGTSRGRKLQLSLAVGTVISLAAIAKALSEFGEHTGRIVGMFRG